MKLYSGPLSLFTAKVRVALAEKQLDYQRVEVGWSLGGRYEPHHPDVLALNPKHEVPILVDGDLVVYDSTLIFEYLEDRFPERALYPPDPSGRARCRQLEAEADEILFPRVWDLIEEGLYPSPAGGRDPARLERAKQQLADCHRVLDKQLAGVAYLCGEFSVADIATFIFANTAALLGAAADPELANLQGWLARCSERPSLKSEIAEMQGYLARAMAAEGA